MKHRDKGIALQDLVQGFLFSLTAEGRAARTREYYAKLLRHLLDFSRDQRWPAQVEHLETKHFRQFLSWVSSRSYEYNAGNGSRRLVKSKPSTAWPYYKALKRLFSWCAEERLLKHNPVQDIHFKAPVPPPIQPYHLDELRRILAVTDLDVKTGARFIGLRNKGMILLFVDSGLRLSELVRLKVSDVDLEHRLVRVIGKGNKIGVCPFSAKTAKCLWLYLLERKKREKCEFFWITEEGKPLTSAGLSSLFARLKVRAGVNTPGRVHRLRHTSALQYLRAARDSFLLQLFLRHEDLTMSRRYTKGLKAEEAIEAHRNGASPVEGLGLG